MLICILLFSKTVFGFSIITLELNNINNNIQSVGIWRRNQAIWVCASILMCSAAETGLGRKWTEIGWFVLTNFRLVFSQFLIEDFRSRKLNTRHANLYLLVGMYKIIWIVILLEIWELSETLRKCITWLYLEQIVPSRDRVADFTK